MCPPILMTIPTALQCNEIPKQTNLVSVKIVENV